MIGIEGGIAQLNHGKKAPLAKMKAGDWIVYYSPRLSLETREPCQHFTAVGKVTTGEVYQYDMGNGLCRIALMLIMRSVLKFRLCRLSINCLSLKTKRIGDSNFVSDILRFPKAIFCYW